MNAQRLADRAYTVTGAASGIGRGLCIAIAREGGRVVLADRDEAGLAQTAATIQAQGGSCAACVGDVTDPDHPQRMVDCCRQHFGRIDGFVPAAGRILIRPLQAVTREEWETTVRLNLTAVFFGARAVAEAIKSEGHPGAIVTFSSTSAHGARPNNIDYGVTKMGVDYLTRTLALEYGPADIRVNAVSPGVTDTPMWRSVARERGKQLGLDAQGLTDKMKAMIPMRRIASVEHIAAVVIYLLSDEASYVTGQIVEADGGFKLCNP